MQISRSAAIQMFKEVGFKTCGSWDDDRIIRKLNNLPSIIDDTPDLPEEIKNNPEHLCNKICNAVRVVHEQISLSNDDEEGDTNMAPVATKTKTAKVKDKRRGRVLSVAEYEGREERHGKKAIGKAKTTSVQKVTKKGERVTVCSSVVNFLHSGKYTTEDMLKKLMVLFPDRDEAKTRSVISSQISYMKSKGDKIEKDEKGRWVMTVSKK